MFVRKHGLRNPRVPLALAYAIYVDSEFGDIDLKEAVQTACTLEFELQALMEEDALKAERRWGR
ncbi:MAG TPA: hypothetical protein VEY92_02860 [Pseudoxanthomonas sp.]|nr:hypothetical protein [Pseudoxanthomonas sp.]